MTLRVALALAAVLAAPAVQAQSGYLNRFGNLTPGNRWEYTETNRRVTPPAITGYLVATVEAEVLIGSDVYSVVTSQRFAPDGTPTSVRSTCAYHPVHGTAPAGSTSLPNYLCSNFSGFPLPPYRFGYSSTWYTSPSSFSVSGQSVTVDSLFTRENSWVGSGGQSGNYPESFALGLGPVYSRSVSASRSGSTWVYVNTAVDLAYARVAGTVYGRAVVADETGVSDADGFDVIVSPNPSATETLVSTRGAIGRVSIDVFDALGRRVDGGTVQGGAPFTFSAPVAGIYVVRVRDEAGHSVTRRVVRR